MLLCGCGNKDIENLSKTDIELKYNEMKDKLIEYGKLVYENEQWLNDDAVEVDTMMQLKDLYERNGYDISMFKNPTTGKQCDLEKTMIEFIITDVSDLTNIKYEFNPVLVCGNEEFDNNVESIDDKYNDLYDKFVNYIGQLYDVDNIEKKNLDVGEYKITLKDLSDKKYDVSMFKNPVTGKQCDLEKSYSLLKVSIVDKKKDYKFNYYLNCE